MRCDTDLRDGLMELVCSSPPQWRFWGFNFFWGDGVAILSSGGTQQYFAYQYEVL